MKQKWDFELLLDLCMGGDAQLLLKVNLAHGHSLLSLLSRSRQVPMQAPVLVRILKVSPQCWLRCEAPFITVSVE